MNLNSLNFLPEWDEVNITAFSDDEGDEWKTKQQLILAKDLYNQWREVFGLVFAYAENLTEDIDDTSHPASTKNLIFQNIMIVAPKLLSAIGINDYVLKMENAAIIRTNCKEMMVQVSFAALMNFADEQYKEVIQESLDKFRELFKQWVATFEKNDYEDEWGLFI